VSPGGRAVPPVGLTGLGQDPRRAISAAERAGFRLGVERTVAAVGADEWNAIAPNLYVSHGWLSVVEERPWADRAYVVARAQDGRPVAGLPLYLWDGRRPPIGPEPLSLFVEPLLRPASTADFAPVLLIGCHAGYRNELAFDPELPGEARATVLDAMLARADVYGAERGARTRAALFLTPRAVAELAPRLAGSTALVLWHPMTRLPLRHVASFDDYLAALRPGQRKTVRQEVNRFSRFGLSVATLSLGERLDDVSALIHNVQRRHATGETADDVAREFALQARHLDGPSRVFFCARERPLGCCVAYVWDGALYARAAGLAERRPTEERVYFNVVYYAPVRHAIESGLEEIWFGPGSYETKAGRGALLEPLWSAVSVGAGRELVDEAPAWNDWIRDRYFGLFGKDVPNRELWHDPEAVPGAPAPARATATA
jgi:predicted N-acyltransferase